MKYYDVIIVGAGPCGLMSCISINNKSILLLDANNEIGGKIKVSGGGRCNITNNKSIEEFLNYVPKNNKFLYSTFNNFSPQNIITFFEKNSISLKEEDKNRIFPKSDDSSTFTSFFNKKIKFDNKKVVKNNYLVKNIVYNKEDNIFIIDNFFSSKYLIVATGGMSYSHISQGKIGYELMESLNHTITELKPAETPLVINDPIIESKELQGISVKDVIGTLYVNDKKKVCIKNDLLFTHFGLSGPLALNLSYYTKIALDEQKIVKIILNISKSTKRLKKYLDDNNCISFKVNDVKGFKTAFVTNGGVNLKEINPQTLESKLMKNLFVGGEILDINCFTGGYNIGTFLCQGKLIGDVLNER